MYMAIRLIAPVNKMDLLVITTFKHDCEQTQHMWNMKVKYALLICYKSLPILIISKFLTLKH